MKAALAADLEPTPAEEDARGTGDGTLATVPEVEVAEKGWLLAFTILEDARTAGLQQHVHVPSTLRQLPLQS
eukprot:3119647-Amphidinium_carterae.1